MRRIATTVFREMGRGSVLAVSMFPWGRAKFIQAFNNHGDIALIEVRQNNETGGLEATSFGIVDHQGNGEYAIVDEVPQVTAVEGMVIGPTSVDGHFRPASGETHRMYEDVFEQLFLLLQPFSD